MTKLPRLATLPTCDLFGVPVAAIRMDATLGLVDDAVSTRRPLQIGVVNAAKLVNMRRDDELRADVLSSDVVLADGMAVVWASRILGRPLPERVAGIDLMMGMLTRGNAAGYRVYCLGATPEVLDGVVSTNQARVSGRRPSPDRITVTSRKLTKRASRPTSRPRALISCSLR